VEFLLENIVSAVVREDGGRKLAEVLLPSAGDFLVLKVGEVGRGA